MHSLFWAAAVIVSAWEAATVGLPLAFIAASLLPTVFLLGLAILARVAEGPAHRRLALVGIAGMLSLPAISVLAHEYGGVVGSLLFDHVAGPVATVVCVVLIAAADLVVQRRSALPYLLPTLAVALPFLVAVADLWTGHLAWFSLPDWLAIEVLLGSGALAVLVLSAVVTRRLWLRVVTVYTLVLAALVGVAAALVPLSYGYAARDEALQAAWEAEPERIEPIDGPLTDDPQHFRVGLDTWMSSPPSLKDARPPTVSLPPLEMIEEERRLSTLWYTGAYLAAALIVFTRRAAPREEDGPEDDLAIEAP
ncbi:hypothetical protein [Nonomuraea dietziae]|uniref:hypothetical protein n=1 Tax=Nonomuraea dietziae TaxID=65515 RepID=UPI00331AE01E